jgi:glycosyltransferase involved in cell wall biosynthesis
VESTETVRVSVIIPCYNTARYLPEALTSACRQTPAPWEVIVVDDGSTDGSAAIAESFAASVRCERRPHQGIGATRNHGLACATGDVVAFLDADDVWTDNSISARATLLEQAPHLGGAGGRTEQFISPELPDDVRQRLVCPPETSAARVAGALLIRKQVFDQVGTFDPSLKLGETIDWIARADAANVSMRIVDTVVLRRRIHDSNTGVNMAHQRSDYLRVLKASLDRRRAAGPSSGGGGE